MLMEEASPSKASDSETLSEQQVLSLEKLREELDIDENVVEAMADVLYGDPTYDPPRELAATLGGECQELRHLRSELRPLLLATSSGISPQRKQLVREMTVTYAKRVDSYEEQCRVPFREKLKEAMGLAQITDGEFTYLLDDLRRPLREQNLSPERFNGEQRAVLARHKEALEASQRMMLGDYGDALDNLRFYGSLEEGDGAYLLEHLQDFCKRRWWYETEISGKEPERGQFMGMLGVSFSEALEEAAEGSFAFGKESTFKKWIPGLEKVDDFCMRVLKMPAEKVYEMLRARGIKTPPKIETILKHMWESPLGKKFWERLLTIESPITVLIFALYLQTATNKVKATMDFAAFLAESAASNVMMDFLQKGLMRANYAALMRGPAFLRARSLRRKMRWLRRMPGGPAARFFAALALMMFGHKYVDQYIISPIEERIPDGDWKHGFGVAMEALSGEAVLDWGGHALRRTGLPQRMGISRLDPDRDEMRFFSEEYLTDKNILNPLAGGDRRLFNTIDSWNSHARAEIGREESPVKRELWEEALITDRSAWAKRKAADLLMPVRAAREKEQELEKLLRERWGTSLKATEHPALLATSTADADEWDRIFGVTQDKKDSGTDYTEGRNDRAIEYLIDRSDTLVGRIHSFTKELPKEDPLRKVWEEYVEQCRIIGKTVAVYRYLNIGYDREQWFGNGDRTTQFALDGFVEHVIHEINRDRALQWDQSRDGDASSHAHRVTDVIRLEEPVDLSVGGMIEEAMEAFGQTKNEVWQMGLLEHISKNTQGTYAFGDPRYNLRNALSSTAQAAGGLLPASTQNEVQQSIRTLARNQEVSTEEQMREAMTAIVAAMSKHVERDAAMAPVDFNKALEIPEDVPVLLHNSSSLLSLEGLARTLRSNFPFSPYLSHDDILLFQCIDPQRGAQVFTMTHINCSSFEPSEWNVTTTYMVESSRVRGTTRSWGKTVEAKPLDDWLREHPDVLKIRRGSGSAMEQILAKQRERAAKMREDFKKFEQEMEKQRLEEIGEQDLARENARKNPRVWIPYPSHMTRLDEGDERPAYEYVAYIPDVEQGKGGFVYMQVPTIYRGKQYVSNGSAHVLRKMGRDDMTRITYEDERSGKVWERNAFKTENVKDAKDLEDRRQLNGVAREVGVLLGGNRETKLREAQMLCAIKKKGVAILVNEHHAVVSEDAGVHIYSICGDNGTSTAEFAVRGGKWMWRTAGTVEWDRREYKDDPKEVKNAKMLADRKQLNSVARQLGMVGKEPLPLSGKDFAAHLTSEEIGLSILEDKYGAKKIIENGETFYRLHGRNDRRAVEFTLKGDQWVWREWGGRKWQHMHMRGDYPTYFNEHRQELLGGEYPYIEGLHLPIEGQDLQSIQKVLAVYVPSMEDSGVPNMEKALLNLYQELPLNKKYSFLSRLEREIYHVTRASESNSFDRPLFSRNFWNEVYPVMEKHTERLRNS